MQRLSWWVVLLAACLVLGLWPKVSATAQATAGRRAVATESGVATRAAMETLRGGGHAVDAAITAALVLGVVNPVSSGLGGGGFALVWDARSGKTVVLDFRETAPAGIDPRALDTRPVADANRGVLIGVPGEVAGLLELHRRWGRRSFAADAAAAIRAAQQGFPLGPHMERSLRTHQVTLSVDGYIGSLFYRNGIPMLGGKTVRSPALAATLHGIASKGGRGFYEGPVAAGLVAAARRVGSPMTREDLVSYAVVDRPALRFSWEGYDVHTAPPPSAGGILLAQTLLMHDKATLTAIGEGSANSVHLLAETFRGSIADRVRRVGDPMDGGSLVDDLWSKEHLERRRKRIGWDRTHAPQRFDVPERGTSHLIVVDGQGNVVSLTTTVNGPFGARVVAPDSGVVLNDELDDFSPPWLMRAFGETGAGPNAPRAGARPVSSMAPTIAFRGGRPVLAVGGSGGMRIAPNVAQAVIRALVFDRSAAEAVMLPRFSVGARSTDLVVEPGLLDARGVHDLVFRGQRVREEVYPSAVQMVRMGVGENGEGVEAGADPRKSGVAMVE